MTTSPTGGITGDAPETSAVTNIDTIEFLIRTILGDEGSSLEFYTSGDAGPEDWENLVKLFFDNSEPGSPERAQIIDFLFESGAIQGSKDYWINDVSDWNSVGGDQGNITAAFASGLTDGPVITVPVTAGGAEDPDAPGDVDASQPAGVLGGGILVQVTRENQEDTYIQMYEYPPGSGRFIAYQYDSLDQALQATPGAQIGQIISENALNDTVFVVGGAGEIIGEPGTFGGLIDDIVREAAFEAGLGDPTILGEALADPEVQALLATSALDDWSDEQLKAQLRQTAFWTETLYPGIDNLYSLTDEPEQAYKQYIANIQQAFDQLGIPRGEQKFKVEQLLDGGVTDTEFVAFAPTYIKALNNEAFGTALQARLINAGLADPGSVIDFEMVLDVLEGTAPVEVMEIVQEANIQFFAERQDITLSSDFISQLAAGSDLQEGQVQQAFNDVARQLIALGNNGLSRYDLTVEDVASGNIFQDQEKLLLFRKAAVEEGAFDDDKADFFVGFNERGAPVREGLKAAAPELG